MNNALQAAQVWEAAVELAIADNSLSSLGRAFVRMVHPQAYADTLFRVSVASTTVKDVIEEHALSVMENKLHDILGRDIHIDISIDPTMNGRDNQTYEEDTPSAPSQPPSSPADSPPSAPDRPPANPRPGHRWSLPRKGTAFLRQGLCR